MIEIRNLTQTYKSGKGIFDIDFTIKEGEVFGYLGPNGAGKTTTIRNILGFMNASAGDVLINGINPRTDSDEVNKIIGYLPGEMAFFNKYTGKQFLDFLAHMRHMTDMTYRHELIERLQLETSGYIKKMSKGMKQKLGIVAALMHDPQILILDEPTSGLDPLMQNVFLEIVLEEKKKGKTILMSSHIFEEVERVCDRAGIIKDGRIITIEDFRDNTKKVDDLFVVTLRKPNDGLLRTNLSVTKLKGAKYEVSVKDNYKQLFETLATFDVIHIESKRQSIEDIFMKYYESGDAS